MRYFLISIDTLRYDIAEEVGLTKLFDFSHSNYYTSSNWTVPAHAAMLTGDSIHHNCHWNWDFPETKGASDAVCNAKRKALRGVTIAELMRLNGFKTIACAGGGFVNKWFAFDRGFDEWDQLDAFSREVLPDFPDNSFIFIHTWAVHNYFHDVHWHVQDFCVNHFVDTALLKDSNIVKEGKQAYRGRVELTRLLVENLLQKYPDDRVVLTGDHGEAFLEDGQQMHHGVYSDLKDKWISNVPLCLNNFDRDLPEIMFDTDLKQLFLGDAFGPRVLRGHYSFAGAQYIYERTLDSWKRKIGQWEDLLSSEDAR